MIGDGRFLRNVGIFLASAATLIAAYEAHAPETLDRAREALDTAQTDLGFTRLDPTAWAKLSDLSVDYAIVEKAANLAVQPYAGPWSDLGGWEAVWQASEPDADGASSSVGSIAIDCRDTLLRADALGQRIVGIGLDDIVAVAMPNAALVAHKDRVKEVKQAVAALKAISDPAGRDAAARLPTPGADTKASSSVHAFR